MPKSEIVRPSSAPADKTITITIEDGIVVGVAGLPTGYDYAVSDDSVGVVEEYQQQRHALAGEHCPDEGCPGVIEDDGECSHCGTDYQENEDGTSGQDRESYSDTQDRDSYTVDPELEDDDATHSV